MKKQKWNQNWKFSKGSSSPILDMFVGAAEMETVDLPHDAMIYESCIPDTPNGAQTGFFPGGEYVYAKTLYAPEDWREKSIVLEFEGVYQTAMVYVNGNFVKKNLYGYSDFYVKLDGYLHYGCDNEIKVMVNNSAVPNSRWYSGSGIYRNVNLLIGEKVHICTDGVRITTIAASKEYAIVEVQVDLENITRDKEIVEVKAAFMKEGQAAGYDSVKVSMFAGEKETVKIRCCIPNPKLWNCDTPELYECFVELRNERDVIEVIQEMIGIRTVMIDAQHGLQINGEQVKLRGTCIHHDNGILGAATFEAAEFRRCRQMKEAGFNSIRSSHHPVSKAMLDACDRYGVLVMDELTDMWHYHKNPHDFATHFSDCWELEVERMVAKDYNHPSVIFYSTGNEIPEYGMEMGGKINRRICNKFYELDHTRFTTGGINGVMSLTFGSEIKEIIEDIMGTDHAAANHAQEQDAISAMNSMMSLIEGDNANQLACHPLLTSVIQECEQSMDVIGLNYLTARHLLIKDLYPNKTVVGTETYPADIVRLWDIVKNNNHVLGDYTWTGYDYLGEAGCGIFHYDGEVNFTSVYPERAAYIGDIDLTGYRRPISYLREIVYGIRQKPYIAVERVNRHGMNPSKTLWMLKDNIASWTWPGYENKPAVVDVYSVSDEVELFLNGKSLGRKPAGEKNGFAASYELCYEEGALTATGYSDGRKTGECILKTAQKTVELCAEADKRCIKADGEDLSFIIVTLKDQDGIENMWESKEVEVLVEGKGTLQAFGSAHPAVTRSYQSNVCDTYDGRVMAVVRAGVEEGIIKVTFKAQDCQDVIVELQVVSV